jgi:hypothetical protein
VAVVTGRATAPRFWVGGSDFAFLNGDSVRGLRKWVSLPQDDWAVLEAEVRRNVRVKDDFVHVPFADLRVDARALDLARAWSHGSQGLSLTASHLARVAGARAAAAVESYKREAEVVDARLFRKVTLGFKATALSDLCNHLKSATGIHLTAGASVADEKVTIFCKEVALRDVMRQLSRPFGYAWTRSGKAGEYKYELFQDLKSQLVEEELRERDRHTALLALAKEMERYRPYLSLSPDEALARSKTVSGAEKRFLERFGRMGWGPVQMYFRLSSQEQAMLRGGQTLIFSDEPKPGERQLPRDLSRGVMQCLRHWNLVKGPRGAGLTPDLTDPRGKPIASDPDARAKVQLWVSQSELGTFTFDGTSGAFPSGGVGWGTNDGIGPLGSGTSRSGGGASSPAVGSGPGGRPIDSASARAARDPALSARVSVRPKTNDQRPTTNDRRPTTSDRRRGDRVTGRRGDRDRSQGQGAGGQEPGARSRPRRRSHRRRCSKRSTVLRGGRSSPTTTPNCSARTPFRSKTGPLRRS